MLALTTRPWLEVENTIHLPPPPDHHSLRCDETNTEALSTSPAGTCLDSLLQQGHRADTLFRTAENYASSSDEDNKSLTALASLLGLRDSEAAADRLLEGIPAHAALLDRPGTAAQALYDARSASLSAIATVNSTCTSTRRNDVAAVVVVDIVPDGCSLRMLVDGLAAAYGLGGAIAAAETRIHVLNLLRTGAYADCALRLGPVCQRAPSPAHRFLLEHRSDWFGAGFAHACEGASSAESSSSPPTSAANFSTMVPILDLPPLDALDSGESSDRGAAEQVGGPQGRPRKEPRAVQGSGLDGDNDLSGRGRGLAAGSESGLREAAASSEEGAGEAVDAWGSPSAAERLLRYLYTESEAELRLLLEDGSCLVPLAFAADQLLLPKLKTAALDAAIPAVPYSPPVSSPSLPHILFRPLKDLMRMQKV